MPPVLEKNMHTDISSDKNCPQIKKHLLSFGEMIVCCVIFQYGSDNIGILTIAICVYICENNIKGQLIQITHYTTDLMTQT